METEKTTTKNETTKASAGKTTAKKTTAKKTTAKKTTAKKTTTAKKPAAKSTGTSVKVTGTEKKLLELYRAADADTKKAAMALLKGEKSQLSGILDSILENKTIMNTVTSLFK